jgi:MFS family permease
VKDSFVQRRQNIHVCIISFGSFGGRLLSGIGSDILVKKLNRSRFWCLFVSASTFCVAQLCALTISNPNLLVLVSGLTGLAYGLLFGVYPSLVAHTFGVDGLSTNWGTMTLSPVITGNIFNLVYGRIYDSHSIINDKGETECFEGLQCYGAAYWVTFFAAIGGVLVCLWSIWHENQIHKGNEKSKRWTDHERVA